MRRLGSSRLLAQGDILLVRSGHFVAGKSTIAASNTCGDLVLAHGERTGHKHVVTGAPAHLYRDPTGIGRIPRELYVGHLVIEGQASLVHEEHATIPLEANTTYIVLRQRELSARAEREARLVAD